MPESTSDAQMRSEHHMELRSRSQQRSPHTLPSPLVTHDTAQDGQEPQDLHSGLFSQSERILKKIKLKLNNPMYRFPILTLFIIFVLVKLTMPSSLHVAGEDASSFCGKDHLANLKEVYSEGLFWKGVNATLRLSTIKHEPIALLILHKGSKSNANCFAVNLSRALSCSVSVSEDGDFYEVNGSEHQKFDESTFLDSLITKRDKLGVVTFTHLEKLPSKFAKSLHYVCDANPKHPQKAIVIMVLEVKDNIYSEQDMASVADKNFRRLWEKDLKERIDPIIGRVINNVVSLNQKFDQIHC